MMWRTVGVMAIVGNEGPHVLRQWRYRSWSSLSGKKWIQNKLCDVNKFVCVCWRQRGTQDTQNQKWKTTTTKNKRKMMAIAKVCVECECIWNRWPPVLFSMANVSFEKSEPFVPVWLLVLSSWGRDGYLFESAVRQRNTTQWKIRKHRSVNTLLHNADGRENVKTTTTTTTK